jgi:hypothetical protein
VDSVGADQTRSFLRTGRTLRLEAVISPLLFGGSWRGAACPVRIGSRGSPTLIM